MLVFLYKEFAMHQEFLRSESYDFNANNLEYLFELFDKQKSGVLLSTPLSLASFLDPSSFFLALKHLVSRSELTPLHDLHLTLSLPITANTSVALCTLQGPLWLYGGVHYDAVTCTLTEADEVAQRIE